MSLTVIVVNWNTGKLLRNCLTALSHLPEKQMISEVIVIDNHSHDDSFRMAKHIEVSMPATFIGLPENIGFAAANNMGIRQRRVKDSEVLLLNPDTEVQPGVITAGIEELQRSESVGVVGVKLLNVDGTVQPSVRNLPTLPVLIFLFLKFHHLFPQKTFWQQYMQTGFDYNKRSQVEQVMGAAFFIRQTLLKKIGLLDESFWVWFEEVDFCKRTVTAGYQVVYTPAGTIVHQGGASFNQLIGLKKTIPFLSSALQYARKHLGFGSYLILLLIWPVAVLLSFPASLNHFILRGKTRANL